MVIAALILALLSVLITLWQWFAALAFPLHKTVSAPPTQPPLTILKPLKGLDDNTLSCLRSWFSQNHTGPLQILLGVASPTDPICEPLGRLLTEFPGLNARLVVCPESLGVNAKVSTLIQLARLAEHEIVVVSDADVLIPPGFLQNAVAPLQDASVGLVNCFYRLANPANSAMRWEAVAINADFWSQVLQGKTMQPLDFALGAVMLTRRDQLKAIGGFEVLADYLADDFQLGNRIVRIAGKSIAICPVVVDCLSHTMNWREVWAHQLRWARTIRACKPLPYAFSILGNSTLWPALLFAVHPNSSTFLIFTTCVLIRIVAAQSLQSRLGRVPGQLAFWWMPPLKDFLQVAVWALAFLGNHITWRGHRYRVLGNGRLVRD